MDGERGSGTVLMVGLVGVVVALAAVLGLLGSAQRARGTAQAAADLAALAAATSLAEPLGFDVAVAGSDACALADEVAARNRAELVACVEHDGGVVDVDTAVSSAVGTAHARARAGPALAREEARTGR